jgi:hypothetical protein
VTGPDSISPLSGPDKLYMHSTAWKMGNGLTLLRILSDDGLLFEALNVRVQLACETVSATKLENFICISKSNCNHRVFLDI